ncbi:hypothetical protein FQN57_003322 [Myotisia sp. PD_48]|nr:hypothetical protein FQN57_003322 [Myotisia sp. PD_48]
MRISIQITLVAFIPALVLSQKVEQSSNLHSSLLSKRNDIEKCYLGDDLEDKAGSKNAICRGVAVEASKCVFGITLDEVEKLEEKDPEEQKECLCPNEKFWNAWNVCNDCLKAAGAIEGGADGHVGERYQSAFSSAYCAETQKEQLLAFETAFDSSFVATSTSSEGTPTPVSSQGFAPVMPTLDTRLTGLVGAGIAMVAGFL